MNYNIFTSRTFWSFVALFIISGTNGILGIIPDGYLPFVQLALTALGTYFHVDGVKTAYKIGSAR